MTGLEIWSRGRVVGLVDGMGVRGAGKKGTKDNFLIFALSSWVKDGAIP